MATTIVMNVSPAVRKSLKLFPMFRRARFVRPGRLLTAREFAVRQRRSKFTGVLEFFQEQVGHMSRIAQSVQDSERTRKFLASPRAIRNHSKGGR